MNKYSFRSGLELLIKHSLKIVAEENVQGAVSGLHNYKARMESTIEHHEDIHQRYFVQVFRDNKAEILKGHEFDSWLLEKDVQVIFGSENPEASHKGFINLSGIYQASKRCISKAKSSDDQLIIYPQIFMLHVYRIFNALGQMKEYEADFSDCAKNVQSLMTIIEEELKSGSAGESNIKTNNLEFDKRTPADLDPSQAIKMMMNDPALDNIFKMVTSGFAQSGMLPKEALDQISINDIRRQFNVMLESDALKKTFEKMNETMSNAKSPDEALMASMNILKDPKLIEDLARVTPENVE